MDTSYKDKLNEIISTVEFNDSTADSLSIKQGKKTYNLKSSTSSGTDFWVI